LDRADGKKADIGDKTVIKGPFTFISPIVYLEYDTALAINLCSTLGTRTASVIPVPAEAFESVAWSDLNETVAGVEWARSRASLPIITEKGLQNITLVRSVTNRPLTLLNFQEPVPAEAYYRQALDCRHWDGGY
jgi:hypothetical protein